jgi:hypothetical protein
VKIDVGKFLQITAALAAVGCERSRPADSPGGDFDTTGGSKVIVARAPDEPAEPALTKTTPTPSAEAAPPAPPPPPMTEALPAPALSLAACEKVSPACEGLLESCNVLAVVSDPSAEGAWGHGFSRPVAEQIATCWATKVKPPACDAKAQQRCVKDAVMKVKVDKSLDSVCTRVIGDCKRVGKPAKYSRDQCLHILSSTVGAARDEATRMMGPAGEGCTLDYVLPYSPFGR